MNPSIFICGRRKNKELPETSKQTNEMESRFDKDPREQPDRQTHVFEISCFPEEEVTGDVVKLLESNKLEVD